MIERHRIIDAQDAIIKIFSLTYQLTGSKSWLLSVGMKRICQTTSRRSYFIFCLFYLFFNFYKNCMQFLPWCQACFPGTRKYRCACLGRFRDFWFREFSGRVLVRVQRFFCWYFAGKIYVCVSLISSNVSSGDKRQHRGLVMLDKLSMAMFLVCCQFSGERVLWWVY